MSSKRVPEIQRYIPPAARGDSKPAANSSSSGGTSTEIKEVHAYTERKPNALSEDVRPLLEAYRGEYTGNYAPDGHQRGAVRNSAPRENDNFKNMKGSNKSSYQNADSLPPGDIQSRSNRSQNSAHSRLGPLPSEELPRNNQKAGQTTRYGARYDRKPETPGNRYYTQNYLESKPEADVETTELVNANPTGNLLKDVSPRSLDDKDFESASNSRDATVVPATQDAVLADIKKTRRVKYNKVDVRQEVEPTPEAGISKWEFTPSNINLNIVIGPPTPDLSEFLASQMTAADDLHFKDVENENSPTREERKERVDKPTQLGVTRRIKSSKTSHTENTELVNDTTTVSDVYTESTSESRGNFTTRRVNKKAHKPNDGTADQAKFEMKRDNPKNRTLYDPNSPSSSKIPGDYKPKQDETFPETCQTNFFNQDVKVEHSGSLERVAYREAPPGRSLYDPTSDVQSFGASDVAQPVLIASKGVDPNLQPVSNVNANSHNNKPTAQVLPIPSTNAPVSEAAVLSNGPQMVAMWMQFIQSFGLEPSQNVSELFPLFLKYVDLRNNLQNVSASQQQQQQYAMMQFSAFSQFLANQQTPVLPGQPINANQQVINPAGVHLGTNPPTYSHIAYHQSSLPPVSSQDATGLSSSQGFDHRSQSESLNPFVNNNQPHPGLQTSADLLNSNKPVSTSNTYTAPAKSQVQGIETSAKPNLNLPLEVFPGQKREVTDAKDNSQQSPSPTASFEGERLSVGLHKRIGHMILQGNIDPSQLASAETSSNPKLDSIRKQALKRLSFDYVNESQKLEPQLESLIRQRPLETLYDDILEVRVKFLYYCQKVIVNDSESAQTHNMEYILWKTAFYPLIERLRKHLTDNSCKYHAEKLLNDFLNEGLKYYEGLLADMQTVQNVRLSEFTVPEVQLRLTHLPRRAYLVMMSAFKLYIGLGDLHRYRDTVNNSNDFTNARQAYLNAHKLLPKSGKAFNQLAILACTLKRRLETVYYYIRSLASQEDFKGARESLAMTFENVARRVKGSQEAQRAQVEQRIAKERSNLVALKRVRGKLVWVKDHKDCVAIGANEDTLALARQLREATASVQRDILQQMLHSDIHFFQSLNKQFVLSFLNIHGILFTEIGLDAFPTLFSQTAEEFKVLINHRPPSMSDEVFIKFIIINIFGISHTNKDCESSLSRTDANKAAIGFGMMMMQVIVDECVSLLTSLATATPHSPLPNILTSPESPSLRELRTFLSPIKLWATWMRNNVKLWHPIPDAGVTFDIYSFWCSWARLLNLLLKINISHVPIAAQSSDDFPEILILPEMVTVAGFKPMGGAGDPPIFVRRDSNRSVAEDAYRCFCLLDFGKFLKKQLSVLAMKESSASEFEACLPEINTPEKFNWADECEAHESASRHSRGNTESSDDGLLADLQAHLNEYDLNSASSSLVPDSNLGSHVSQLQMEKMRLESQHEHGLKMQESKENYLNSNLDQIKIEPRYLVIDTNAFIDHLDLVDRIKATKRYQLIVPLTVVNELEGLSRPHERVGGPAWKTPSQYHLSQSEMSKRFGVSANESERRTRAENATQALQYIERTLLEKQGEFKVKTWKGVVIHDIRVKSSFEGSNDDAIIETALHNLSSDSKKEYKSQNGAAFLKRNVVLLTEDRNLILKSIFVYSLPATTIQEFVSLYDLS